jgi:hypothetical protein
LDLARLGILFVWQTNWIIENNIINWQDWRRGGGVGEEWEKIAFSAFISCAGFSL